MAILNDIYILMTDDDVQPDRVGVKRDGSGFIMMIGDVGIKFNGRTQLDNFFYTLQSKHERLLHDDLRRLANE